jgi:uncharacterized membrane protein YdjX (TVP38/TMEM64 family)
MTRFLKNRIVLLALLLTTIALLLIGVLVYDARLSGWLFDLQDAMERAEQVREGVLAHGPFAPLLFIALQMLQVILAPIPGEASGVLGGYLFGALPGFFYSSIGLTLGSWLAFTLGRLLSDLVRRRLEQAKTYQRFNHLVSKGDFFIPFVLFLLPGFPKDALSYMLGMSHMPLPVFLFITGVGRMPGTMLLSLQGAEVYQGNFLRLALLLGLSALLVALCALCRKRLLAWLLHYSRRTFDAPPPPGKKR